MRNFYLKISRKFLKTSLNLEKWKKFPQRFWKRRFFDLNKEEEKTWEISSRKLSIFQDFFSEEIKRKILIQSRFFSKEKSSNLNLNSNTTARRNFPSNRRAKLIKSNVQVAWCRETTTTTTMMMRIIRRILKLKILIFCTQWNEWIIMQIQKLQKLLRRTPGTLNKFFLNFSEFWAKLFPSSLRLPELD